MYSEASSSIKLDGFISRKFIIENGVQQGDVLSPLLFNILINDIIEEFDKTEYSAPYLIDKQVRSLLYADNLVVLST